MDRNRREEVVTILIASGILMASFAAGFMIGKIKRKVEKNSKQVSDIRFDQEV